MRANEEFQENSCHKHNNPWVSFTHFHVYTNDHLPCFMCMVLSQLRCWLSANLLFLWNLKCFNLSYLFLSIWIRSAFAWQINVFVVCSLLVAVYAIIACKKWLIEDYTLSCWSSDFKISHELACKVCLGLKTLSISSSTSLPFSLTYERDLRL